MSVYDFLKNIFWNILILFNFFNNNYVSCLQFNYIVFVIYIEFVWKTVVDSLHSSIKSNQNITRFDCLGHQCCHRMISGLWLHCSRKKNQIGKDLWCHGRRLHVVLLLCWLVDGDTPSGLLQWFCLYWPNLMVCKKIKKVWILCPNKIKYGMVTFFNKDSFIL